MLSYRHGFHAGNHADVFKHAVEVAILRYLLQKDKPLSYIDTHAGGGLYFLNDAFARKNREHEQGVEKILAHDCQSEFLGDYGECVRQVQALAEKPVYPGSPAIARQLLRPQDRLQLCELHPQDAVALRQWAGKDKRIHVAQTDGLAALHSYLPPKEKRALVLMDPPYEVKSDYQQVCEALAVIDRRFATGVTLLWYPLLQKPAVSQLEHRLRKLPGKWLLARYWLSRPSSYGEAQAGMYGSGVFVRNPPYRLKSQLQAGLPEMTACLSESAEAGWSLEDHE